MKTTKALMGLAIAIIVIFAGVSCAQPAPAPSPSPAPTPTPSPTPTPTPTPTASPTPAPPPPSPQEVTVDLAAENIRFDKSTITVPAGAMVTVRFNNKDSISHNFALYETSAATNKIFAGEIISGPQTIEYRFQAPETPGTYFFRCDVHPTAMKGDFVVTGP